MKRKKPLEPINWDEFKDPTGRDQVEDEATSLIWGIDSIDLRRPCKNCGHLVTAGFDDYCPGCGKFHPLLVQKQKKSIIRGIRDFVVWHFLAYIGIACVLIVIGEPTWFETTGNIVAFMAIFFIYAAWHSWSKE